MILVIGATGKVGTELTAQLQAQRVPFRALAHTTASHARLQRQHVASVLVGNAYSPDVAGAFEAVDRLFLLLPSSPDHATLEQRFVEVAKQAGVRHIVKLSVLGADAPRVSLFKSHQQSERFIKQSGVAYTLLRPNAFMQNTGTADVHQIRQHSSFGNSAGDGKIGLIDARDIAAAALAVLQDDRHSGQTYDLTGPEALSYFQVAEQLSGVLGRPIRYVALSDAAYRGALSEAGLPDWHAGGLAEIYRFYRAGGGSGVTDLVEQLTGRPARTFATYLADHRALFA